MVYQSKTTMLSISVQDASMEEKASLSIRFDAALAAAVHLAEQCGMDIMSVSHYGNAGENCRMVVTCVNNGRSIEDIRLTMKPELFRKTTTYWYFTGVEEGEGFVDCDIMVTD